MSYHGDYTRDLRQENARLLKLIDEKNKRISELETVLEAVNGTVLNSTQHAVHMILHSVQVIKHEMPDQCYTSSEAFAIDRLAMKILDKAESQAVEQSED